MNTSSTISSYIKGLWNVVFYHLRSRGCSRCDAEELTQETFCRLAARNKTAWIEEAANCPEQAYRVRNYVLVAARNLHCDHLDRRFAIKRGASCVHLSLNNEEVAEKYHPKTDATPADEVQRKELHDHWNRQIDVLEEETTRRGQKELFELMRASLYPEHGHADYDEAAQLLGCKRRNVRVQACRWRTVLATRVRNILEPELAA